MSELRWLCAGTGDIVRKRAAAALAHAEGGSLVGFCGGLERARSLADEHGAAEVYDNLDDALARTQADAVYIGTPVHRHADEALRAINAGKHVLIEKPLGLNAPDAQRMADAAHQAGVVAGCAYYRRTYPRFSHLKAILQSGELGRIVLVRTACWSWFNPTQDDPKHWRVEKALSGGGPLADMGCHMFDVLIGLLGMPRSVFAQCATLAQEYEVEDSSAIVMTMPDGAQVLATFGWNSRTWAHEFEVVGTEGKVTWTPADTGPIVTTRGRDVVSIDLPNAANVHEPLVVDFNAAVATGRAPVCPLTEAVKTNQLLDAIYRSSEEQAVVAL